MAKSLPVKIFGVTQAIVLVVVIVTLYIVRKRREEDKAGYDFSGVDFGKGVRRVEAPRSPQKTESTSKEQELVKAISSAFPCWDVNTPPHEILEVPANASASEVEAAYRKQLKKFHPDRFAHWGKGYQNRAHHVIVALQKARDALLSGKRK